SRLPGGTAEVHRAPCAESRSGAGRRGVRGPRGRSLGGPAEARTRKGDQAAAPSVDRGVAVVQRRLQGTAGATANDLQGLVSRAVAALGRGGRVVDDPQG